MYEFKIGDIVHIICEGFSDASYYEVKSAKIIGTSGDSLLKVECLDGIKPYAEVFIERSWAIPIEIWDSPLFKAMLEN